MRIDQGFGVVLEPEDQVVVTQTEGIDSIVSLHGSAHCDVAGYRTWGVTLRPCPQHIAAVKELLAALEEQAALVEIER